ncbi:MAG: flavin oxidoreductase/NADH oxidase, partial [Clostridia bacterium]|nr:flavin oxidoreductase/NADH oxidase [Clostridia bacterium]
MNRRVYMTTDAFKEQNSQTMLPFADSTAALSKPLKLGTKTAANRLVCQAMEGCDGKADGTPDTLTLRRYDRFARGGAGLIWF